MLSAVDQRLTGGVMRTGDTGSSPERAADSSLALTAASSHPAGGTRVLVCMGSVSSIELCAIM